MITEQVLQNTPQRTIKGKVELYQGSTLVNTFNYNDNLMSAEVSRQGSGKFFGYGVSQKLTVVLRDASRLLEEIATGEKLKFYLKSGDNDFINCFPTFEITEIKRDENNNNLTITAYDALYHSTALLGEHAVTLPASLGSYVEACANAIGIFFDADNFPFIEYVDGANLEGSETIREVLNAAAEATQTIYFIDRYDELIFKQLKQGGESYLIDKSQYFTLEVKTPKQLGAICSATELGDNLTATLIEEAETQYVRDNPFLTLREDLPQLLEAALAEVGGLEICQFNCSWRGNYLLEIGDRIEVVTKNNETISSYVINDTIKYNGGLRQSTSWEYTEEKETESNPSTLGEAIKQTYARVDKANKKIDIVASESDSNAQKIAALQINTESVNASVEELTKTTTDALGNINGEVAELTKKVNATITKDDIRLEIENELSNGVDKVKTATNFTFDEKGLKIAKENNEISTQITEDGMTVSKNEQPVLIANNEGVKAEDLHATTFLIIGTNSRLENYNGRTACFWIGG